MERVKLEDIVEGENVRRVPTKNADKDLVVSIRTHGLLQPPIVHEADGKWEIKAGHRRINALRQIYNGDYEVTVVVVSGEHDNVDVGLVENEVREQMHPMDVAEAITRMLEAGEDAATIGDRFNRSGRWVLQRQQLCNLTPAARKRFRRDEFGLGVAQKLCKLSKKDQSEGLQWIESTWRLDAMLKDGKIPAERALFDIETYPKDKVFSDLFEDDVYLEDMAVFLTHQAKHIQEVLVPALELEGWNDVQIFNNDSIWECMKKYHSHNPNELVFQNEADKRKYKRLSKKIFDLEEAEEPDWDKIHELRAERRDIEYETVYSDADKKKYAVFINMDPDGVVQVKHGVYALAADSELAAHTEEETEEAMTPDTTSNAQDQILAEAYDDMMRQLITEANFSLTLRLLYVALAGPMMPTPSRAMISSSGARWPSAGLSGNTFRIMWRPSEDSKLIPMPP